ncbi:MAG: hypothetical protein PHX62_00070 [Bacilli bacterium]|nr:hypothetical protein [Bacilli bacterium]
MKSVKKSNGDDINYLSFASKYCRRYNPSEYPIFDNIVKDVLKNYLSTTNFYQQEEKIDFGNYVSYKKVVEAFIKKYSFIKNYLEFDQYLWCMGKEKLEAINLIKKTRKNKDNKKILATICKKLSINENYKAAEIETYITSKNDIN